MDYVEDIINTLNEDQSSIFNEMRKSDLLQICIPTGVGKGYIMMVDILNKIINSNDNTFVIASHRLMLNTQHLSDLFNILSPYIGYIGFVYIGSSKFDTSMFKNDKKINTILRDRKLSYNDLFYNSINRDEVKSVIDKHMSNNRKVVILTTYHSMDKLDGITIDNIYCDESHILASHISTDFKSNYEKLKYNKCYHLTATPKDCPTFNENAFLMNNTKVFGRRVGLNFRECVDKGYLVRPLVHIAMPSNYNSDYNYKDTNNIITFIISCFTEHRNMLKTHSSQPNEIEPKILVKCSSVDEMWDVYYNMQSYIQGSDSDIILCAGASINELGNYNHYYNGIGIKNRSEYLEMLQKTPNDTKMIVLHYDTMSEGINVSGFTGVMFLGGKLPTITKVLQNTGRATRLHPIDRKKLRSGEISVKSDGWVKPFCSVIIPYYDRDSEFTAKELARQIKELRDNFGYDPTFYISLGDDIGDGIIEIDLDEINNNKIDKKSNKIVNSIIHEMERLCDIVNDDINDITEKVNIDKISKLNLLKNKL